MGSPVSPIVANLFLEDLEQRAMSTAPASCKPRLWKRYVDDILEIVKKDGVDELTSHLNAADPTGSIKFTYELEKDGSIPFLDVLLTRRSNGSIRFTVYRKPTHTNQYLNFQSHHPLHQKLGVGDTLLHRCETVVLDPEDKTSEIKNIHDALADCGYPPWAIKTHKPSDKPKQTTTKPGRKGKEQTQPKKPSVVIPYVKGLSEAVHRVMRKYSVSAAMKPCNKLRNILVHPKDKVKEMDKGQGVYKVPCLSCPAVYIGETGRKLGTRIEEHKKDCDKLSQRKYTRSQKTESQSTNNKSAITDHAGRHNHIIDWESTRLIARESHDQARRIREAIWIRKTPCNMNRDGGAYQLSDIYSSAIAKSATRGDRKIAN